MRLRFLTRRHHRARFMWWLMVGLLATPGLFSTLVLCVGGNGHFAMETTHVPSTQHGAGGSCLDVPVLTSAEKPSHTDVPLRLARDDRTPPLTPDTLPMATGVDIPCRRSWQGDLAMGDPILPALRTVILLI